MKWSILKLFEEKNSWFNIYFQGAELRELELEDVCYVIVTIS